MNESITVNKENDSLDRPLVVDLDGSLIKTELPWESFLSVLSKHPFELIKIIWRKIRVKEEGYFKIELEKRAKIPMEQLPFSNKFLNYLKEEKARGRTLILCTGSTQSYAEKIQDVTGLFDSVWGSTLGKNVVGRKKAMFLVGKYGEGKFDYAGNSLADLKVAKYAHHFILVNPSFLTSFFFRKFKVYRRFMEKELEPSSFANTLGFPLWFLNCIIFLLPLFASSSADVSFFALAFSVVHFNFSVMAFHVFFKMTHIHRDRKEVSSKQENLFATGDLNIPIGLFLVGLGLFLALVSFFYLVFSRPLSVISLLLYVPCVYLLVHKKIGNRLVPAFIRYALLSSVVLLQGAFIVF